MVRQQEFNWVNLRINLALLNDSWQLEKSSFEMKSTWSTPMNFYGFLPLRSPLEIVFIYKKHNKHMHLNLPPVMERQSWPRESLGCTNTSSHGTLDWSIGWTSRPQVERSYTWMNWIQFSFESWDRIKVFYFTTWELQSESLGASLQAESPTSSIGHQAKQPASSSSPVSYWRIS